MRKTLLLLILTLFSFSAIHAERSWEINGIKCNLSDDGTFTISGTGNMPNYNSSASSPWLIDSEKIKKVVIEDGVTSIGNCFFYWCTSLTSITIPNSVMSIGNYAFYKCKSLTSITIPNSVTSIGDYAFAYSGLTSITIPNSVASIGNRAFENCPDLTSITVEKGNTKYDSRDNCNAIIETNTNKLIAGCKNTTIPNSVTSIGERAFEFCSSLTSITIPNSVTSIGRGAFYDCSSLTSITIPNSVTSIGESAFQFCFGLTSITIPNSVTSIGERTFEDCESLTSITIPNSVTSIGERAFCDCFGLTSITFNGSTPPEFGKDVFKYVSNSISVYVPANNIEAYKSALGGLGLSDIKALPLIYLKDGEAYTQDSQIDGMDIYYTRSFANTNWQALYLPFSLNYEDWKDDFEVAYINTVRQYDDNGDGRADRTIMEAVKKNSGSTAPNTPYLIRAKTAGEKTFFVENATLYPAENNSVDCSTTTARFTFTGIYKEKSFGLSASNYYAINEGRLTALSAWLPVPPYRWYMSVRTRSSVYDTSGWGWAKEISISVVGEEETTGVADIQHLSPDTQIFDINGRKVSENSLKPGIYVKNGKKFVVK